MNKWTLALAAAGLVTLPGNSSGEEKLSPLMTALSSTTISGYVNTSAQWNPGTGNANSPVIPFQNGKQDGFNLDVVKLTIERGLDEAQWSAGYKVETLFGTDANLYGTQSTGFGTGRDFGIKQAYVALRAPVGNGLDFKMGVWDTCIGYEVFDAGSNKHYTRSYGYAMEPVTHTGVLASYQFNDVISASAGVANTYGPTINGKAHPLQGNGTAGVEGFKAESYKTYVGLVTLTAPESFGFLQGSTLVLGAVNGFNDTIGDSGVGATETSLYAGGTINTPVKGLTLGAAVDYVFVDEDTNPARPQDSGYANAYALYVSYQLTSKLSAHVRGEYATSDMLWLTPANPDADGSKVMALTGTLQYDLWANVLSRLEVRWDHAADGSEPYGGTTPGVGGKKNAFAVIANVIYKF